MEAHLFDKGDRKLLFLYEIIISLSIFLLSLKYIIYEKTGVNFSWVILLVVEKN